MSSPVSPSPRPTPPAHTPGRLLSIMGRGGCFLNPDEADAARVYLKAYPDLLAALKGLTERASRHIEIFGSNSGAELIRQSNEALAKAAGGGR